MNDGYEQLKSTGLVLEMDENEVLIEAVVIFKTLDMAESGAMPAVRIGCTEGGDWISQRGLIETARSLMLRDPDEG